MKKKEKTTHLLGKMGGSVQKGLIPYTRCGRRTKFSAALITNVHQDSPLANCTVCVKAALADIEEEIAWRRVKETEYKNDIDKLTQAWRKYVRSDRPPVKPSEF